MKHNVSETSLQMAKEKANKNFDLNQRKTIII